MTVRTRQPLSFEPLRVPGERPSFRGDIEGLRGIAVLLVVLYHAGVPGFAGGYIGVDVFFALSGYLITGILVAEVEQTGRLDFARFYARRARRLLPAVAVLLLAVAAFGYVFYAPIEQFTIAKTSLATAAYVSNFFFATEATDYLAADAETNPLLHTWSLSVEEQFYLGWPLLVVLGLVGLRGLRRARDGEAPAVRVRTFVGVMIAVSVVSFAASLWLMDSLRTHWAFFASPPRAWEFALGGIGALVPRVRLGDDRATALGARALGWAGLAAIIAAGALYSAQTPFPGWAAVIPVVGTILALRAGAAAPGAAVPGRALGRALGWAPLQVAGRLSYSWYLWHWPVLVFAVGVFGELSLAVRVGLMVLALGLAEASYRLVEDPVRHHRGLARRPAYGLALMAAITIGSVALSAGWWRVADAAASAPDQVLFASAVQDRDSFDCITGIEGTDLETCVLGDSTSTTTVVLYGDSHAHHLMSVAERVAGERGWRLETVMKSSCAAINGTRWHDRLGRDYVECDEWKTRAQAHIRAVAPDLVLVGSSSNGFVNINRSRWVAGIRQELEWLREASSAVLLFRDVPRPDYDVPGCLSMAAWRGKDVSEDCVFPASPREVEEAVFAAEVAAARQVPGVSVVDIRDAVCDTDPCTTLRGDSLVVWRDSNHLTASFARTLTPVLAEHIDDALARADGIRGTPVTEPEGPELVRTGL